MNAYSVFGICLHSSVEFPRLPAGGEVPDIVIEEVDDGSYRRRWEMAQGGAASERFLCGHFYRELRYVVEEGHTISFHRSPTFSDDLAARCLLGLPMAIALRQRGVLTLHACAVAKGGNAVAFLGPSGAGKSTLAEVFNQRGYEVLTDDLLAIRFDEGLPVVLPGPPQIRLRAGSGAALLPNYDSLPLSWEGSDQRLRTVSFGERVPVSLSRLYLIDAENAPVTVVQPANPQEAVLALLGQTWAHNAFNSPGHASAHVKRLGDLVRGGYVARLRRVRSLQVVSDYVEAVERDVAARGESEVAGASYTEMT